jgi:hypothetical protein
VSAAGGACAGTPVSWLRLERYHAGEADGAERRAIDEHLAGCEACAACLRRIRDDEAIALAPLPLPARPPPRLLRPAFRRAAALAPALAAAALLVFVGGRRPGGPDDAAPGGRAKGDDVGFALVREGEGPAVEAGGVYRDGERFKALVTCPPEMRAGWDVVVFERGEASFPLEAQPDLACGNGVALPGAFRLTGRERMTICLVWGERGPVDRAELGVKGPRALDRARCLELEPAP